VTNAASALYERRARTTGLPALEFGPTPLFTQSTFSLDALISAGFGRFVEPVPVRDLLVNGRVGLPLLTRYERDVLAEGIERHSGSQFDQNRPWLRFALRQDNTYLLVPEDSDQDERLTVLMGIPNGPGTSQFRRLDLGTVGTILQAGTSETITVDSGCAIDSDTDDPRAAHIRSCVNNGCTDGCESLVLTVPSTGEWVLTGCQC
jgi:hypothetical protein